MTSRGFEALGHELRSPDKSGPEVYVHVVDGGALDRQVLRIGKAKHGVIDRWIKQGWGHRSTFLWAIGGDQRYGRYAEKYPNYLAFFASLSGIDTKLHILSCSDNTMNECERSLITYFCPVWESYKDVIKKYLEKNPEARQHISKYGGAKETIEGQRNSEVPLGRRVPDALDFAENTKRRWDAF